MAPRSALPPLWLRFWPQAVLAFGLGLMFGSTFVGLFWAGAVVMLAGAVLLATYFAASSQRGRDQ